VDYFERIWESVPDGAVPEQFERRRAFLLAHAKPGDRVLDVGCGEGEFAAALLRHGAVPVAADVAAEPLRRALRRFPELELVQLNRSWPFTDGTFTLVWAGELLEHVEDAVGLIDEIARVLRPGGTLLVTTPAHGLARRIAFALSARRFEAHFEPRSDHLRFFTVRSLRALLESGGFREIRVRSRRGTLFAEALRP
jgi:ubiquinone/menaquinone biosynthesis C-methylase UbiE